MKSISTIILLILIAIVGVFTLDVYLPGMPSMADQFGVSITDISYTFTAFSIVFAISQVFHGVLSDAIGRKPVVVLGLGTAAIATFFCINAVTYNSLFAARMLQAVGISSFVVVNAIIRDLYAGSKAVQIRTLVATTSGISISIAPTIGGLLQNQLGWQGGFIASLILIIIALIYALLIFEESHYARSKYDLRLNALILSYKQLFRCPNYIIHVCLAMLAYTVHFSFIILSATIFVELLGATPLVFGYLMFVYGGVYFLSGILSARLAKKLSIPILIKLGGTCIGIGGVLMSVLLVSMPASVWQILLPMAVMTLGITMARASAITGALAPIPEKAGQGAAGLNLVQFALSAIIATGVSKFGANPQLSISVLAIASSLSIIYLVKRVQS